MTRFDSSAQSITAVQILTVQEHFVGSPNTMIIQAERNIKRLKDCERSMAGRVNGGGAGGRGPGQHRPNRRQWH